jgi:hypothetical protein
LEGLIDMSGRADEALAGGQMADIFKKLNLDANQFKQLGVEEQFYKMFDALNQVADPADRVRYLLKMTGEDVGKQLAPLLGKSSDELRKMAGGFAVNAEEMKQVQAANKAVQNATNALGSLWRKIVVALAPLIEVFANALTKLGPVFDWLGRAAKTYYGIMSAIWEEIISAIFAAVEAIGEWVGAVTGMTGQWPTVEEVITFVMRNVVKAFAYAWDTLKAGAGAIAYVAGLIVEGFGYVIDAVSVLTDMLKDLPDSIKPDWVDDLIKGVDRAAASTKKAGQEMRKWGRGTFDNWGKSADAVDMWFDKLGQKKAVIPEAVPVNIKEQKPQQQKQASYTAVAAALKGSKEEASILARFKFNNLMNPQLEVNKKQLDEAKKANQLLGDVVRALTGMKLDLQVF